MRSERPNLRHQGWGNRRRRTRRVGAAAANERRAVRSEPQAVVRSTLPKASAVLPTTGVAGQGERGEVDDERGAQRRREERTAVKTPVASNLAASVSVRQRR